MVTGIPPGIPHQEATGMRVSMSPRALAWIKERGLEAITVKEIVTQGGCCAGGIRGTLVESGPPEDGKRYEVYQVEGIDVHVAGNLPAKLKFITVVLKGLLFRFLDIEGYDPKGF